MKNAIEKAIEGGYDLGGVLVSASNKIYTINLHVKGQSKRYNSELLIDPLFWQSLGKAMGWKEGEIMVCVGCGVSCEKNEVSARNKHTGIWNGQKKTGCDSDVQHYHHGVWEIEWENFIHHLAEGKDADSFFDNLLK